MKILLRLYANFEEKMPAEVDSEGNATLELEEGTCVAEVLDLLQIPHREAYAILLYGRHAKLDAVLFEGAELTIFPAIVGG
ncbi:MAG: MoaD/ThiS family protein [Nitrospinota bacterium]|nr:MoaD/ThiS family protein [Nitrospinota bacterium]